MTTIASKEDEETNWWQEIEDFAYCLDGKAPEDWHAMLQRVAADMPAPNPDGSLEDFKRYAVYHLIQIFAAGPCPWAETDAEEIARYARATVAVRRAKLGVVGTDTEEQKQARVIKAAVDSGMTVINVPEDSKSL